MYLRREAQPELDSTLTAAEDEPLTDGRETTNRLRRRFTLSPVRYERRNDSGALLAEDATIYGTVTVSGLLGHSVYRVGSSRTEMVEVRGLEPLASSVRGRISVQERLF